MSVTEAAKAAIRQGIVYAAARTALQAAWGYVVTQYAIVGLVPQETAIEAVLTVVVIGGATVVLRWLESRQGEGFWPRAARGLAKVLMLGLTGKQPVYVAPGRDVKVVDGEVKPLR